MSLINNSLINVSSLNSNSNSSINCDFNNLTTLTNRISLDRKSKLSTNSNSDQIDFITKTKFSNYNIGLKISNNIVKAIKELLFKKKENLTYILNYNRINDPNVINTNRVNKKCLRSEEGVLEPVFYTVSLFISGDKIIRGVFDKTVTIEVLFKLAEKISEINKRYLAFTFLNELIIYDEKNIKLTIEDLVTYLKKTSKPQLELCLDIEVDYDTLGQNIGQRLVNKMYELEDEILKDESKRNIILIRYVFDSVAFLQGKFMNIHGMTFDAVKKYVFKVFE